MKHLNRSRLLSTYKKLGLTYEKSTEEKVRQRLEELRQCGGNEEEIQNCERILKACDDLRPLKEEGRPVSLNPKKLREKISWVPWTYLLGLFCQLKDLKEALSASRLKVPKGFTDARVFDLIDSVIPEEHQAESPQDVYSERQKAVLNVLCDEKYDPEQGWGYLKRVAIYAKTPSQINPAKELTDRELKVYDLYEAVASCLRNKGYQPTPDALKRITIGTLEWAHHRQDEGAFNFKNAHGTLVDNADFLAECVDDAIENGSSSGVDYNPRKETFLTPLRLFFNEIETDDTEWLEANSPNPGEVENHNSVARRNFIRCVLEELCNGNQKCDDFCKYVTLYILRHQEKMTYKDSISFLESSDSEEWDWYLDEFCSEYAYDRYPEIEDLTLKRVEAAFSQVALTAGNLAYIYHNLSQAIERCVEQLRQDYGA